MAQESFIISFAASGPTTRMIGFSVPVPVHVQVC